MEHEDLQEMVRAVRQFVRSEVVPEETTIDASDAIPERIRQQAIDMGLYGFALTEAEAGSDPAGRCVPRRGPCARVRARGRERGHRI